MPTFVLASTLIRCVIVAFESAFPGVKALELNKAQWEDSDLLIASSDCTIKFGE